MRMRRYQEMAGKRKEGLLVGARPLEQAERISRSMVEEQVVDGALLLVLISTGVPLFGPLNHDVWLTHTTTRHFENGFVQSKYRVADTL